MNITRNKKRLFDYKYENRSLYLLYKYHNHFFHSLINRGNKLWAFNFFIKVKFNLKKTEQIDPLVIFFLAITNITPEVLLFPFKSGGLVNQVAMPITNRKQIIFATKWVIKLLKDKYRILSISNISSILLDAIKNNGIGVNKKEKIQAEATRNRFLIKYFK